MDHGSRTGRRDVSITYDKPILLWSMVDCLTVFGSACVCRRDLFYRLDPADSMMLSTKEEVDKKATEIAVMEGDLPTPEEINRLIDECGELGALESVWRVMDALRRRHYQAAYSVSFTTYVAALDALIKNGRWDKASRLLQDDDVPRCLGDLRGLLG